MSDELRAVAKELPPARRSRVHWRALLIGFGIGFSPGVLVLLMRCCHG